MARSKKLNIPTREKTAGDGAMFVSYGSDGPSTEIASSCLEEIGRVHYTSARSRFSDIEPGISVREGTDRMNHDFFRPGEHIPQRKNDVIRMADSVYRHNGVVKIVIDMMADFVTQGVQIYHPVKSKQRRYRHWWKKVGGQMVSERLVNLLYRHGVAIPKRNFGVLNAGDIRDLEMGVAAQESDKELVEKDIKFDRTMKPGRNRIPLQYTFLNPVMVEVVGGELSIFAGQPKYGLKIPDTLLKLIKNAKTTTEKMMIANLPNYLMNPIGSGRDMIDLDPEKVSVHFYKKDDWQLWADPMILSVMKDIILYEKMKDADNAALDGCLRSVRLWTLGLPEHKIQPGPGAFRKLKEQLAATSGGGNSLDLVWDATLKFTETNTNAHQFLGSAKYEPVMQAIYAGLGLPQNLGGGKSGSMTGDALSLKTLMERLQYARNILIEFWEREFHLIQRAFNDKQPARLRFDMMTLSDEAAEKMLWVQLFDRNLVSTETMREKFGLLDDIENSRIKREYNAMDSGKTPHKVGPFTEAQPHPDQLVKAAMQQGSIAPSEAGVKTQPKKKGDKSLLDRQDAMQQQTIDIQKEKNDQDMKLAEKQQKIDEKQGNDLHGQKLQQNDELHKQKLAQKDTEHKVTLPIKQQALKDAVKIKHEGLKKAVKQKGQPGQGRPLNKVDEGPRKRRTPKPRTSAELMATQALGRELLKKVSDALTPKYLESCGKKNLRLLTTAQADTLEIQKFYHLVAIDPEKAQSMGADEFTSLMSASPAPDEVALETLKDLVDAVYKRRGLTPTTEDMRDMFVATYATLYAGE